MKSLRQIVGFWPLRSYRKRNYGSRGRRRTDSPPAQPQFMTMSIILSNAANSGTPRGNAEDRNDNDHDNATEGGSRAFSSRLQPQSRPLHRPEQTGSDRAPPAISLARPDPVLQRPPHDRRGAHAISLG